MALGWRRWMVLGAAAGLVGLLPVAPAGAGPIGSAGAGPIASACSGQLLGNPGFETGAAAPWKASAGVISDSPSEPPHAGSWDAWLGGYGTTHTDTLSQQVTVPAGCRATLSFYLHIDTADTSNIPHDTLTVKANATTLAVYSNVNHNAGYLMKAFDLSSFAGQSLTISFIVREDATLPTSFVIDDVTLTLG